MINLKQLAKIPKNKILVFDLEHTGYAPPCNELLQFSAIWADGTVAANIYVKPSKTKKWKRTMEIHHITPEMVKDCPRINKVRPLIQQLFKQAKVIVGYSTKDDMSVFKTSYIRMPDPTKCMYVDISIPFIDIYGDKMEDGKKFLRRSLQKCAAFYGYTGDGWHNSLVDAEATAFCFNKMLENGDLGYVSKNRLALEKKPKTTQPKMKGSKTLRKKKQERQRVRNKKMNNKKAVEKAKT